MTDAQIQSLHLELIKKKILVNVHTIDGWDSWTYSIEMEGANSPSPFFVAYSHDGEFETYMDALRDGVKHVLDTILEAEQII